MSYYEDIWVPGYKKVIDAIQDNPTQKDLLKKPILKSHASEIINTLIKADHVAFSYSNSGEHFQFISQCW